MKKRGVSSILVAIIFIFLIVISVTLILISVSNLVKNSAKAIDSSMLCGKILISPMDCVFNSTTIYGKFKIEMSDEVELEKLSLYLKESNSSSYNYYINGDEIESFELSSFVLENSNQNLTSLLIVPVINNDGFYYCPENKIECRLPPKIDQTPPLNSSIPESSSAIYRISTEGGGGNSGSSQFLIKTPPPSYNNINITFEENLSANVVIMHNDIVVGTCDKNCSMQVLNNSLVTIGVINSVFNNDQDNFI